MIAACWISLHLPLPPAALLLAPPLLWTARRFRLPALTPFVCFLLLCVWRLTPPRDDLRRLLTEDRLSATLQITIAGDAVSGPGGVRVPVRVRALLDASGWRPADARVLMRLDSPSPMDFTPGSRWQVSGRLDRRSLSHTGLRHADWLLRAGAESLQAADSTPPRHPVFWFYRARNALSDRLTAATAADPEAGQVLQALLLARRGDVEDEWTRAFARTGLIHVFAVSGLHLGLLAALLLRGCQLAGVPFRWRIAVVLPVLFLFTACTGFRASAVRALIMSACLITAPALHRRPDPRHAFSLALILILLLAPEQLTDLGFQYSFLLVGGLLFLAACTQGRLQALLRGDPWAPEDVQWPWWKQRLLAPLGDAAVVSTLCFLLSAPLTARVFHLFSPIALPGNLLAVPLAFLILASGFPVLPALLLPPALAGMMLTPPRLAARLLLNSVAWLEGVPGGVLWTRAPALWQLALFYGLPVLAFRFPRARRLCLATGLTALGFSLGLEMRERAGTVAWMPDADRGQATFLRAGFHPVLAVDAGSEYGGRTVAGVLKREGINRVAALFVTHPSRHHLEGLREWSRDHPPERIYVAAPDAKHPAFAEWNVTPLQAGDRLALAGWEVEVLWPPRDWSARAAGNRGLVLRFSRGFASLLVMGGADGRVETELLARGGARPARLLLAANTGGRTGMEPDFLAAVAPEAVVFAGREFGGPGEARLLAEARVRRQGIALWRVDAGQTLRWDLTRGAVRE